MPRMTEAAPKEPAARSFRHVVRLEKVDMTFGKVQALSNVDFKVGRNEIVGFIDVKKEKEIADQLLRRAIGFRGHGVTAESTVRDLSGGERQGIAIARAMYFEADLIVLDEPTTALAVSEVRKVLAFVEGVKAGGRACIYIEHNLAHAHEVADRLVILDRGRVVGQFEKGEINLADLTARMIALHEGRTHAGA